MTCIKDGATACHKKMCLSAKTAGAPGRVNISGDTYLLLKGKFDCEHRGKIQAKGKGEIDMYFVNG